MRQPVSLHTRKSLTSHPPYGLFIDPHGSRHNWALVEPRVLLGITALGAIAVSLLAAAR